ncbi:putative efflux pump outer membrane protein TtgC precursor [Variibacter gotjawalensis]|uniref:Putative efflux pump outer membrane protein TtgC n=1 Tax=Variibacter gotjawalensis TaxID=1333996 RepID=A0A0S3PVT7_9BRAD|nr:efflux transporter outer membrane subunit [Variibacter gotjawalensis]NIK45888.1 NodT family efflux transporter outer membrane factor (OMF) lipoprotein [Variibacter gotjawalensis]RZS47809.1 NodT family efflux transporter outer membrane factor (OMF) lipoprotein [Variibacter gotjawalensis]BAT60063.1 putative efflux pump outer membrane protein TtgC precursor [Variibacter gotjawalensis]
MGRAWTARAGGLLVSVSLLGACTLGPDFKQPDAPETARYLPPSAGAERVGGQRLARGAEVPSRWWERFGSGELTSLIDEGIAHNSDLHAAEAAVRIAEANARVVAASLFPVVTGSFAPTRQRDPVSTLQSNAASGAAVYSVNTAQLSVSFVPDVFGGTRRNIESAQAQVEVADFQREAVYQTLAANIALAAIQEASLRGQVMVTQRLITLQTQLLGLLRKQSDAGQIALPDVLAQETALAQTKLLLPPLQRQLDQQRNLLATLTGKMPSGYDGRGFILSHFRLPRDLPLSLPAELVRQRPDVRAAEATLHSANAQIGVAIVNRLPQLTLTANAGSSAATVAKLFTAGTGFWFLGANAAQVLFDAGQLKAKQTVAEETFMQAAAQYRSTVIQGVRNVADTLAALKSDADAVNASIAAERAASRNIELLRQQVDRGQISLPSLITAQQAYLQTSLARVQAEAARLADTVALFQALGGGWWNRPIAVVVEERVTR